MPALMRSLVFKRAVDPLDELVFRAGVEDCWVMVNLDS